MKDLKVKCELDGDIRRFSVRVDGVADLQSQIRKTYNLEEGGFGMKYKDDDGDLITLELDSELEEALVLLESSGASLLKLSVRKAGNTGPHPEASAGNVKAGPPPKPAPVQQRAGGPPPHGTPPGHMHAPPHGPPPGHMHAPPHGPPPGHMHAPPHGPPPGHMHEPPHGPPPEGPPSGHMHAPPHGPPSGHMHAPPHAPPPGHMHTPPHAPPSPSGPPHEPPPPPTGPPHPPSQAPPPPHTEPGTEPRARSYQGSRGGYPFSSYPGQAPQFPLGQFNFGDSFSGFNDGNFNLDGIESLMGNLETLSPGAQAAISQAAAAVQRSGQLPMLAMSLPTILPRLAMAVNCAVGSDASVAPTPEQSRQFSADVRRSVEGLVSQEVAGVIGSAAELIIQESAIRALLRTVTARMGEYSGFGEDETGPREGSTSWNQHFSAAPTATEPAPMQQSSVPQHPLRRGDQGNHVEQLHRCLANLGYLNLNYLGTIEQTQFGPHTEEALLAFQADFGLAGIEDGVYEGQTHSSMKSLFEVAA
ncbi:hypothetical protein NDN08_001137 [Rhodosorus marinus]|uniref:PB1 domain-containing protein n=1 Tax=Rhodosorus marinus TaxID=101924 RepID=A0AAV8UQ65_9RHOD|nr:hypothetical protein NDN08_001137 [Rhodosorus marinus]